jgi:glucokinase
MYIGLDVGGTNLKGARIDPKGAVLDRLHEPISREHPEELLRQLESAVARLEAGATVEAVGIGVPATVDHTHSRMRGIPNLPALAALQKVDLGFEVQKRTGHPAVIENDANAAGMAEAWLGAGRGAESVLFMTLGTGVGGAVILGGRLWTGRSGYAGEIGHIPIDPKGVRCGCGAVGCLETVAGNGGWIRRAKAALETRASALGGQALEPATIVEAARAGDSVALEVVDETASALGRVIGGCLNLLNVERVVIGGGISAAGPFLLDRIVRETQPHCWPEAFEDCSFGIAELGGDAGVVGAARVAMVATASRLRV